MAEFSQKSLARLGTCHGDLQRLFMEVVKTHDCSVLCGHRGKDEQDEAYALGHSKAQWPDSKHNSLPSHAVDVAPWPVDWFAEARWREFAEHVKATAEKLARSWSFCVGCQVAAALGNRLV